MVSVELWPVKIGCSRSPSSFTDHDRLYITCRSDGGLFSSSLCLLLIIAHLLLSAGDIEQNPGPIAKDAKPTLQYLQYMSYTSEDGKTVHFRLMDRIKPRVTQLAIALSFPRHVIDDLETKRNPVYYILSEWLRGGNQENDQRPLTWETLVTALQHAGLLEEAKIVKKYVLATPPVDESSTPSLTSPLSARTTSSSSVVQVDSACDVNIDSSKAAGNPHGSEMGMRQNETELMALTPAYEENEACKLLQQKPQEHQELRECVDKHTSRNPPEVDDLKEESLVSRSATASLPASGDRMQKLHCFKTDGIIRNFKLSDSDDDCNIVVVMNDREKTEVCFSGKGLGTQTKTESAIMQAVDFLSNHKLSDVDISPRGECQQLPSTPDFTMKGIPKNECVSLLNSQMTKHHKALPKYTETRHVSEQVYIFTVSHELFGTITSNACKGKTSAKQNAARKAIVYLKSTQQWK